MEGQYLEPACLLTVNEWADVIVAGGGIAGIAAALSARRAGAGRVLLIEREYTLGGLATLGLVTIYLPLCDGRGRQVSFGIAEELLKLSVSHGAEVPIPDAWLPDGDRNQRVKARYRCQFNAGLFASLAEQLLLSEGVEILFGTAVCEIVKQDKHLEAVIVENANGRSVYPANGFVDATGDAVLCRYAGEATVDFKQGNVLAAWHYTLENGQMRLCPLGACDIPDSEKTDEMRKNDRRTRYAGTDARELSRMMTGGRKLAVDDFLRHGEFSSAHALVTLPTIPQVRMTRRLDNDYNMTLNMDGRFEPYSVGLISNWKKAGPVYEVPFGAICARTENLYTAGRCIAAEEDMWDVTRVIPCCAVTGEAAGVAAAGRRKCATVQRILQNRGIPLHIDELND